MPLLKLGLDFLNSQKTTSASNELMSGAFGLKTETDPQTGKKYFKVPAPNPEKIQQLATCLAELFRG